MTNLNENKEEKNVYTIQVDLPKDIYERREKICQAIGQKKNFFDVKAFEFYIQYHEKKIKNNEN